MDKKLDFGLCVAKLRFTLLVLFVKVCIASQFIWFYLPKPCSVGLGLPKNLVWLRVERGGGCMVPLCSTQPRLSATFAQNSYFKLYFWLYNDKLEDFSVQMHAMVHIQRVWKGINVLCWRKNYFLFDFANLAYVSRNSMNVRFLVKTAIYFRVSQCYLS